MKYLLIDGNNLAVRSAFANEQLRSSSGIPTGVHFGFFQSLILLKKTFPEHQFLIVWDGTSARRVTEAKEGVRKGIVPSGYKENRKTGDERPQPLIDFYTQAPYLQRGVGQTGIPQIRLREFEADDIVASYANLLKANHEVTAVTSDKDYWQILDDKVDLWDGMKVEHMKTTKQSWMKEYGIEPIKAIDVGAFCGDDSDNIFGVPGWGIKTAIKEIAKHESMDGVFAAYHKEYDGLRKQYPDICKVPYKMEYGDLGKDELKRVRDIIYAETEKKRRIYPDVTCEHPWAGVVVAFHEGKVKMPKTTLMALVFEDRVHLAYSLKRMDNDIPDLPSIENGVYNMERLKEYFDYYDIHSLRDEMDIFSGKKLQSIEKDLDEISDEDTLNALDEMERDLLEV